MRCSCCGGGRGGPAPWAVGLRREGIHARPSIALAQVRYLLVCHDVHLHAPDTVLQMLGNLRTSFVHSMPKEFCRVPGQPSVLCGGRRNQKFYKHKLINTS